MKTTEIAAIFNEWYNRYVKDPTTFNSQFIDEKGSVGDYGITCANYFLSIAKDLGVELDGTTD